MDMTQEKPKVNVDEFLKLSDNEIKDAIKQLNYYLKTKEEEKIQTLIKSREGLIGKCFKRKIPDFCNQDFWRYYKIISPRGSNQTRVSTLAFDEYPLYKFRKYLPTKIDLPGYSYFGKYKFEGIRIIDFPYYCYNWQGEMVKDDVIEIDLKEYNDAMTNYINHLKDMEWTIEGE